MIPNAESPGSDDQTSEVERALERRHILLLVVALFHWHVVCPRRCYVECIPTVPSVSKGAILRFQVNMLVPAISVWIGSVVVIGLGIWMMPRTMVGSLVFFLVALGAIAMGFGYYAVHRKRTRR